MIHRSSQTMATLIDEDGNEKEYTNTEEAFAILFSEDTRQTILVDEKTGEETVVVGEPLITDNTLKRTIETLKHQLKDVLEPHNSSIDSDTMTQLIELYTILKPHIEQIYISHKPPLNIV